MRHIPEQVATMNAKQSTLIVAGGTDACTGIYVFLFRTGINSGMRPESSAFCCSLVCNFETVKTHPKTQPKVADAIGKTVL